MERSPQAIMQHPWVRMSTEAEEESKARKDRLLSIGRKAAQRYRGYPRGSETRLDSVYEFFNVRRTLLNGWPEDNAAWNTTARVDRTDQEASSSAVQPDASTRAEKDKSFYDQLIDQYPLICEKLENTTDPEEEKELGGTKELLLEALSPRYEIVERPSIGIIFKPRAPPVLMDPGFSAKELSERDMRIREVEQAFERWCATPADESEYERCYVKLCQARARLTKEWPDLNQYKPLIWRLLGNDISRDTKTLLIQKADRALQQWRETSSDDPKHADLGSEYRDTKLALQQVCRHQSSYGWKSTLYVIEDKWRKASDSEEARQALVEYEQSSISYLQQCPPNRPGTPEPVMGGVLRMSTNHQWREENPRYQAPVAPRSRAEQDSFQAVKDNHLFRHNQPSSRVAGNPRSNDGHEVPDLMKSTFQNSEAPKDRTPRSQDAIGSKAHPSTPPSNNNSTRSSQKLDTDIKDLLHVLTPLLEQQRQEQVSSETKSTGGTKAPDPAYGSQQTREGQQHKQQDNDFLRASLVDQIKGMLGAKPNKNDLETGRIRGKPTSSEEIEYDVHGRRRIVGPKRAEREQDPKDPKRNYLPGEIPPPEPTYLDRHGRTELQVFQSLVGIYFLDNAGVPLPNRQKTIQPASVMSDIFVPSRAASNRHRNRGLYDRCISQDMKMRVMYSFSHYMITFLYLLQILVAATLTGLSSYTDTAGVALTTLGAINTVLAGILAWLNGQGMPVRYRRSRDQFREVVRAIEDAERMFCTIDYMDWAPGTRPTPVGERDKLFSMYEKARRDQEANYPDTHENADKSELASNAKALEAKIEKHKRQKKEKAEQLKQMQDQMHRMEKESETSKSSDSSTTAAVEFTEENGRSSQTGLDRIASEVYQKITDTALAKFAEERKQAQQHYDAMRRLIDEECVKKDIDADEIRKKADKITAVSNGE